MLSNQFLSCTRCAAPFTFSVGEQLHYTEHGWVAPKHCHGCRQFLRQRREGFARDRAASAANSTEASGADRVDPFQDFDQRRKRR